MDLFVRNGRLEPPCHNKGEDTIGSSELVHGAYLDLDDSAYCQDGFSLLVSLVALLAPLLIDAHHRWPSSEINVEFDSLSVIKNGAQRTLTLESTRVALTNLLDGMTEIKCRAVKSPQSGETR
jgi:hypothetical protein